VSHGDPSELMRYAAGDLGVTLVARHVERCSRCAADVVRLRAALTALRAVATSTADLAAGCLDEHHVAALTEGSLTVSERAAHVAHLATCARCRVAVSSLAHALSSRGIAHEVSALRRKSHLRRVRYAAPLGAAAAVAAIFMLVPRTEAPPVPETPAHRQGSLVAGPSPVAISPVGPTTAVRVLRWHAVRGVGRYRVTVFDEVGLVLFETTLADTTVALPADVEIAAGRRYYWIVAARTGFDRWDTSALAEFSTTGAGR